MLNNLKIAPRMALAFCFLMTLMAGSGLAGVAAPLPAGPWAWPLRRLAFRDRAVSLN